MNKSKLYQIVNKVWKKTHLESKVGDKNNYLKLHSPTFGPDEITAFAKQMITTNVTMGKNVEDFEKNFSKMFNFKNSVTSNSGSSANLLMIAALRSKYTKNNLKEGDEVIIPALTWSTSLFPLLQYGLKPVFVDCDLDTLNIDASNIEDAIGTRTKAIFVTHVYGNPCNMDDIVNLCKLKNILLIEDSCESMGAFYNNNPVGSFGLASSFSFYFSHHITCMEGGITVSKKKSLSETMKIIRSHGWIRNCEKKAKWINSNKNIDPKFLFVDEGYNLRLTEPQAVMADLQLKKLKGFVKKRRKTAEYFKKKLRRFNDLFKFQKEEKNSIHSWFGFPLTIVNKRINRNDICKYFNKYGIETRPVVSGNLSKQPAVKFVKKRISGKLTNADFIMENSFSIGCHQDIKNESVDYVEHILENYLKKRL